MPIIFRTGLFEGERLRKCSDLAQLHWSRLFLASNGYARIELNFHKILGVAYAGFHNPPSPADLKQMFQEYIDQYLLFPYKWDGRIWGQWDAPRKCLGKYWTAEDRRSPEPPEPDFTDWRKAYQATKDANHQQNVDNSLQGTDSIRFPKFCGNISEKFPHGIGIGIGIGIGKNPSRTEHLSTNRRHLEQNSVTPPPLSEILAAKLNLIFGQHALPQMDAAAAAELLRDLPGKTPDEITELCNTKMAQNREAILSGKIQNVIGFLIRTVPNMAEVG